MWTIVSSKKGRAECEVNRGGQEQGAGSLVPLIKGKTLTFPGPKAPDPSAPQMPVLHVAQGMGQIYVSSA